MSDLTDLWNDEADAARDLIDSWGDPENMPPEQRAVYERHILNAANIARTIERRRGDGPRGSQHREIRAR